MVYILRCKTNRECLRERCPNVDTNIPMTVIDDPLKTRLSKRLTDYVHLSNIDSREKKT